MAAARPGRQEMDICHLARNDDHRFRVGAICAGCIQKSSRNMVAASGIICFSDGTTQIDKGNDIYHSGGRDYLVGSCGVEQILIGTVFKTW